MQSVHANILPIVWFEKYEILTGLKVIDELCLR